MSATWIERWPVPAGDGPVVAVKDLIDVAGTVTTAGCRAVASSAEPAAGDAVCIRRVRAAGGRLAGKVNLHELAYGTSGINPWYGMPENPADPGRVPGGSSSGSAVAVATGEADVALGTDTGGSIRIPAACCGVVGLKTTWGRIPLGGVWPLAPSFDTVGPLARGVSGVVAGMALLEAGFGVEEDEVPLTLGRAVLPGVEVDPSVTAAVDEAVRRAEIGVEEVTIEDWRDAWRAQMVLLDVEAWRSDRHLVEGPAASGVGDEVAGRLRGAGERTEEEISWARAWLPGWVARLGQLSLRHAALVLPTLAVRPPEPDRFVRGFNLLTAPVNLAGLPALSLPVPVPEPGRPPAGLQLVGPAGGEAVLCSLGLRIEAALAT